MAYLHENQEEFTIAVNLTSERFSILPAVAEKDYYVTMILRGLSERLEFVVFKGGTSLSKCHKAIKRFSEDIDITIDTSLSQNQKKMLKQAIKDTAEDLNLTISNIDDTKSRRSYNIYILEYVPVASGADGLTSASVLLETSFSEVSFPTTILPVYSYIGDMMETEAPEKMESFFLEPFKMKVQGIDRTLADKVFAICDYYIQDQVNKHSRHIYDIFKLLPLIPQNDDFKKLVHDVRAARAQNKICPSAQLGVSIPDILTTIIKNRVYKDDYENVTVRLLEEPVSYETAIEAVKTIAESGMFNETL